MRMIENHRRSDQGSSDLLDMMLSAPEAWSEEMLRDQVITIFLAGFETVANALTWTWYLLSENPEAGQKLFAEMNSGARHAAPNRARRSSIAYTEMVFAESMRLYPPAWAMGREARADFELGPYRLPAGTTILMSQFITQRDARHFAEPRRFDPGRFAAAGKATFPKFAYFPFGAGYRQCIGESLAWMGVVTCTCNHRAKVAVAPAPGQAVQAQALITLRSKFGMQMRAEKKEVKTQQKSA